jgi:hypothetical protein
MKYRAYVIYGGQFIYGRSAWRDSYAEARSEGRANASPEEREFIGVIDNGPDSSPFVMAIRRGLERMGEKEP